MSDRWWEARKEAKAGQGRGRDGPQAEKTVTASWDMSPGCGTGRART